MTNNDLIPGSRFVEFWNKNSKGKYSEGYRLKPDSELHNGDIFLEAESFDIPYNGKILRITVSEWGTVELLESVKYT